LTTPFVLDPSRPTNASIAALNRSRPGSAARAGAAKVSAITMAATADLSCGAEFIH
jgi:hypothetical protein